VTALDVLTVEGTEEPFEREEFFVDSGDDANGGDNDAGDDNDAGGDNDVAE